MHEKKKLKEESNQTKDEITISGERRGKSRRGETRR